MEKKVGMADIKSNNTAQYRFATPVLTNQCSARNSGELSSLTRFSILQLLLLFLFFCASISAQIPDSLNPNRLRYDDHVYKDYIKSVQLHQVGWKFSPPLIQLHSGDQLQLDFDDLAGDYIQYSYTLVHCDADWQPSDLVAFDYLKGFNEDQITEYYYSFATFQKFTHYRLYFPNKNMQLLLSGNYLLKVYKDGDPDSLVITRKVMVYEDGVRIHGREKQGLGDDIFTKQEIIFTVNTSRYPISDPFHALQIFISQNGRWDNAIVGLQPAYLTDTALIYDMDMGNSFDGGNQFRSFDNTSLKYLTQYEESFVDNKNSYEINLKPDVPRAGDQYYTFPDLDGQYWIYTKDADSTPISAEYVYMNFFMPIDSQFTTGDIYIFGAFTDWQCQPDYKMHYDSRRHGYVGYAYLKQGYYEYQYAFLKKGSTVADCTVIEGNHFETTNTYYLYAYYRPVGYFYDKLIGYGIIHAPSN